MKEEGSVQLYKMYKSWKILEAKPAHSQWYSFELYMNMIEYMYIHIFTHKLFFMEQTLPNILCSAASGRTYGGIQGVRG